jgi:hypothetical protein
MDDSIEINDDDDDVQSSLTEESAADQIILELISLLQRKKKYPARTRNKIDRLVNIFLRKIEKDVHKMICYNYVHARDGEEEDEYDGIDSDRETEDEVEAIVRCFPKVLSRKGGFRDNKYYPIQRLTFVHDRRRECNMKAVPFIPVLLKFAIEFGVFKEKKRGGLLCENDASGNNPLQDLVRTDKVDSNREHHEAVDDKYLAVIKNLRKMGIVKKEDIQKHSMLRRLICENKVFAEKRFRFLVEWDPTILLQTDKKFGFGLLHFAVDFPTLQVFKSVFEYGIIYYPNKKGISLLFQKNKMGMTPFQMACKKWG